MARSDRQRALQVLLDLREQVRTVRTGRDDFDPDLGEPVPALRIVRSYARMRVGDGSGDRRLLLAAQPRHEREKLGLAGDGGRCRLERLERPVEVTRLARSPGGAQQRVTGEGPRASVVDRRGREAPVTGPPEKIDRPRRPEPRDEVGRAWRNRTRGSRGGRSPRGRRRFRTSARPRRPRPRGGPRTRTFATNESMSEYVTRAMTAAGGPDATCARQRWHHHALRKKSNAYAPCSRVIVARCTSGGTSDGARSSSFTSFTRTPVILGRAYEQPARPPSPKKTTRRCVFTPALAAATAYARAATARANWPSVSQSSRRIAPWKSVRSTLACVNLRLISVRMLSPSAEFEREVDRAKLHRLPALRDEVHLDPLAHARRTWRGGRTRPRSKFPSSSRERTRKHVLVERGSDATRIVVRGDEDALVLHEVHAQEKPIARGHQPRDVAKERRAPRSRRGCRWCSRETRRGAAPPTTEPRGRHARGRAQSRRRPRGPRGSDARARCDRADAAMAVGRDVERDVAGRTTTGAQRSHEQPGLARHAAANLDERAWRRRGRRDRRSAAHAARAAPARPASGSTPAGRRSRRTDATPRRRRSTWAGSSAERAADRREPRGPSWRADRGRDRSRGSPAGLSHALGVVAHRVPGAQQKGRTVPDPFRPRGRPGVARGPDFHGSSVETAPLSARAPVQPAPLPDQMLAPAHCDSRIEPYV